LYLKEESMSSQKYSPEFKSDAVKQVVDRGYPVKDVAERIGVPAHTLYLWVRHAKPAAPESDELAKLKLEVQKLKADLKRAQEERDILKKAAAYFAKDHE
jgi:transposase